MLNSPHLLVFESYSPALAEFVCRQCVARKWATKAYCRPVMRYCKKKLRTSSINDPMFATMADFIFFIRIFERINVCFKKFKFFVSSKS